MVGKESEGDVQEVLDTEEGGTILFLLIVRGGSDGGMGADMRQGKVFITRAWISLVRWGTSSVGSIFVLFVGTTIASNGNIN